jgi:methylmalonyl-CoA epimerase
MKLRLAHIGIVVKDLEAFGRTLQEAFGAEPMGPAVVDPAQEARLQMYRSGSSYLELIAPASDDSHVHRVLKRQGEGLLHLCFETDNLDAALEHARQQGMLVFRPPTPAVLLGGKRVAFAMLPNRMVVEFAEEGWDEAAPNG